MYIASYLDLVKGPLLQTMFPLFRDVTPLQWEVPQSVDAIYKSCLISTFHPRSSKYEEQKKLVKICVSYLTCSKKKKKKKPKSLQTRSVDQRNYPLFAIKLPPFKSMLRHLVSVSYCNCHLRYIDRGLGVYIKKPFLLKAADYVLSSIYNGHKTSLKLLEI